MPTFDEQGIRGLEITLWQGAFVPTLTPPQIIARLHDEMAKAVAEPSVVGGGVCSALTGAFVVMTVFGAAFAGICAASAGSGWRAAS